MPDWPLNPYEEYEYDYGLFNAISSKFIEAHNKWLKENECEMIDMQTGLRHRVIKLKTGESQ